MYLLSYHVILYFSKYCTKSFQQNKILTFAKIDFFTNVRRFQKEIKLNYKKKEILSNLEGLIKFYW